MRHPILAVVTVILLVSYGCAPAKEPEARRYNQLTIQADQQAPGIDISAYTLITNNPEEDRRDAAEIMRVKGDWPRAMQKKDKALFESILARDFTFRAEDEWYERDAYIRDRVGNSEIIGSVRYENLVLQFFAGTAVLTYRNIVNVTDGTGGPRTAHMSWADVFVRERGRWKIGGSHLISTRVEEGH